MNKIVTYLTVLTLRIRLAEIKSNVSESTPFKPGTVATARTTNVYRVFGDKFVKVIVVHTTSPTSALVTDCVRLVS